MKKLALFCLSILCLCLSSSGYAQQSNNCAPPDCQVPDQNCGECYCLYCHYEPYYYNKWHCNYEPCYTYKKCCRYVTQSYEKQCCKYEPRYYTKTCYCKVPQYYYTCSCNYKPKYTCEKCCSYRPKYYYKKTDCSPCADNMCSTR
jgi:hypothetical protein